MLTRKETFEPNTTVVPPTTPAVLPKASQTGKGTARKIGRYLAEPAFIAGCGLAGALYAAQHDNLRGDNPVMGMAALAAHLATFIGVASSLSEWSVAPLGRRRCQMEWLGALVALCG